jgi:hypothetical protein
MSHFPDCDIMGCFSAVTKGAFFFKPEQITIKDYLAYLNKLAKRKDASNLSSLTASVAT